MSRPKSRQVGTAGLLLRHRDGTCTHTCRRCGQFNTAPGWHAGLRAARAHAAEHAAADARYVDTPWGIPDHELPPTRRQRPLRRLAAAVVVLALAVLAFGLTVANVSGHAAPAPSPVVPSIAVVPAAPPTARSEGYVPTPAGPPATDSDGTWTTEPAADRGVGLDGGR
jgi:hypothetical protein